MNLLADPAPITRKLLLPCSHSDSVRVFDHQAFPLVYFNTNYVPGSVGSFVGLHCQICGYWTVTTPIYSN